MEPNSWPPAATAVSQGDGSAEPVYTVDLPEYGVQVRITVQYAPADDGSDDADVVESGYGHGV
jgi:hypothetical protein